MIKRIFFTMIVTFLFTSTIALADSQYDGWWYKADESGSGVSLEIQGDTLFAAIYTYDDGDPVWMTAVGTYDAASGAYWGSLYWWTNGDDSKLANNPSSRIIGRFYMKFLSQTEAEMSYGEENATTMRLTKFMPSLKPGGIEDERVLGWWYDPRYDGSGCFLEAQGGTIFGAFYYYYKKKPIWFSFSADFTPSDTSFSTPVTQWSGGSKLGQQPYTAPTPNLLEEYVLSMTLNPDGSITMTMTHNTSQAHLRLERFRFK